MGLLATLWAEYIKPMVRRPPRLQVAALCWRPARSGAGREVLLITSRDTGRWIIPKGWPMRGRGAGGAALQEAWEEAGVRGELNETPVGRYHYDKIAKGGHPIPVETMVYAVRVTELAEEYPEVGQRRREWTAPAEAARRVREPELKSLLERF